MQPVWKRGVALLWKGHKRLLTTASAAMPLLALHSYGKTPPEQQAPQFSKHIFGPTVPGRWAHGILVIGSFCKLPCQLICTPTQNRCSPHTRHNQVHVSLVQACPLFLFCDFMGGKWLHVQQQATSPQVLHLSTKARKIRGALDVVGVNSFQVNQPVLELSCAWLSPALCRYTALLPPTHSTQSSQCSEGAQGWGSKCLSQFKWGKDHHSILHHSGPALYSKAKAKVWAWIPPGFAQEEEISLSVNRFLLTNPLRIKTGMKTVSNKCLSRLSYITGLPSTGIKEMNHGTF